MGGQRRGIQAGCRAIAIAIAIAIHGACKGSHNTTHGSGTAACAALRGMPSSRSAAGIRACPESSPSCISIGAGKHSLPSGISIGAGEHGLPSSANEPASAPGAASAARRASHSSRFSCCFISRACRASSRAAHHAGGGRTLACGLACRVHSPPRLCRTCVDGAGAGGGRRWRWLGLGPGGILAGWGIFALGALVVPPRLEELPALEANAQQHVVLLRKENHRSCPHKRAASAQ
jgi:hypothetical protein